MSTGGKFVEMFMAIGLFALVFIGILLVAGKVQGRHAEGVQSFSFVAPALIFLSVGLLYPAVRTILTSFRNSDDSGWVGAANYSRIFTDSELLVVLRNTALWVFLVPLFATAIGLLYAVVIDKAKGEAFAKSLIFLPMAISFVGASIIWKFVYDYKSSGRSQIGLGNEILTKLGFDSYNFILKSPWNTLFLIVVMVWIQAGFAMVVLSAAIKAIPADVIEAARLDGVNALQMFRQITLPSIRPAVIVVLTTIGIATLKVFDIVRVMTNGSFNTSVIANEFVNQSFRYNERGLGAALAVVLFVLVVPIVVYNVRQLKKAHAR